MLLQDVLPPKAYNAAKTLLLTVGMAVMSGILLLVIFYVISSPTFGWTGAYMSSTANAHAQRLDGSACLVPVLSANKSACLASSVDSWGGCALT